MTFGDPVDPRFVRFKDYVTKWVIDHHEHAGLRWHPQTAVWFFYPLAEYDHLDIGAAPTPTPLKSTLGISAPVWQLDKSLFNPLPSTFTAIDARRSQFPPEHRGAVWNVYDGEWRLVRPKRGSPTSTVDGGTDRVVRLRIAIDAVNSLYDAGKIDDAQRDAQIAKLLDEAF
ncbi:hypothetical protein [Oerskovia turbata]